MERELVDTPPAPAEVAAPDELSVPPPTARPIRELSAVMPAHDEQDILPESLAEAVAALETLCDSWELIVVDDGSTDRTPEILGEWSRRDPRVRVVTLRPQRGYSRAIAAGFEATRYLTIFYTDADAQFDLREIVELYPWLRDVDMVAGYRIDRQDPWTRRFASAVYNRIQAWALGLRRVRDVNCAFKLFRRSFFEIVRLSSDGFLIDAEMYARASRAGLRWTQVGVTHRPRTRGSSTVRARTVSETLRELRSLRRSL